MVQFSPHCAHAPKLPRKSLSQPSQYHGLRSPLNPLTTFCNVCSYLSLITHVLGFLLETHGSSLSTTSCELQDLLSPAFIEGSSSLRPENERLWIQSRLIEMRFAWGRPLKILATDIKKTSRQVMYKTKNHLWLVYIQCIVHTYVNADMYVTFESL